MQIYLCLPLWNLRLRVTSISDMSISRQTWQNSDAFADRNGFIVFVEYIHMVTLARSFIVLQTSCIQLSPA